MNHSARQSADQSLYTRSASRLADLFYSSLEELGQFDVVASDDLTSDYRTLLAHNEHMTAALEEFHHCLVDVRVLAEWRDSASYARASLLVRRNDGATLQFGVMRIWLGDLPPDAKEEITDKKVPLGRVLIEHNMLREVELITLWKITPGPVLEQHRPAVAQAHLYGRSAQILVDARPTIQMLEIPFL